MNSNKIIWANINKIAPKLRLTAAEYKCRLAQVAAKRDNGSLANLSSVEAAEVLKQINADAAELKLDLGYDKKQSVPKKGYNPQFDRERAEYKMANKVKYYARQMGWEIEGKLDVARLDAWCEKSGKFKKELKKHDYKELCELVTQIEKVNQSLINSIAKKQHERDANF